MKGTKFLSVAIAVAMLLALSAGLSAAQGPAPQGPGSPQVMVASAFTYQGQLKKDANLVNDTCEMIFSLYDDVSAGAQVGGPLTLTVAIADGLFTVPLDFGSDVFTGDARWLEIAVQCTGDAGLNTLAPRQELTAAPYALSLRPGATISGTLGMNVLSVINSTTALFPAVGVYGESDSGFYGYGVSGYAPASSGWAVGVVGETRSPGGAGVWGNAPSEGVYGRASADFGETYGVYGRADSTAGRGVYGYASSTSGDTAYGVYGESDSTAGIGVRGYASATTGTTYGVHGQVASPDGRGVVGYATAASGDARGVYGRSNSSDGVGVYGLAAATSGTTYGVYGEMNSEYGAGVYGYAPAATSSTRVGVKGVSWADQGRGVYGVAYGTTALADGVLGESYNGLANGVSGIVWTTTGTGAGVFGQTHSPTGYAGLFSGNVYVDGTLSAAVKLFKIDHPLDPANKYLYHYSMESAEVLNQYSGNVVLDADGSAWVDLPDYFEALNKDYRYQLTCIGGFAPVYVAQEVQDNRFQIAGGPPGLKVSWEITALRSDPYIQRHGAPVEVEKPAEERGTYLHPELYGQPEEQGLDYRFTQGRPGAGLVAPDTAP